MSWEYARFHAKCKKCGKEGFCIQGFDDWNRRSASWEGFTNLEPNINAVARKRADARDKEPLCDCGGSSIQVGEFIEDVA